MPFIKNAGYNEPDFIVNGATIDVKTTYSPSLWFQQPKFNIYVLAHVSPDNEFLQLSGFIFNDKMIRSAKQVTRGNRVDYVIPKEKLLPMHWLALATKRCKE